MSSIKGSLITSTRGMETWQEKRSHTMNLRSVFTAEQYRILERYYENGMTNQSKSCFQLILQCAQETKLDFSVVRTWVGNKRRKLASKPDQNGVTGQNLSNHHGPPAAGGTLVTGSASTGELAGTRSSHQGISVTHLIPPHASCSSSSSSPLSSSLLSTGSGPHSDVILTDIYSSTRTINRFDTSTLNTTMMVHENDRPARSLNTEAAAHPAISKAMQTTSTIIPSSKKLKCSQLLKHVTPTDWAKQHRPTQSQCTTTWPHSSPRTTAAVHCSPPQTPIDNSIQIQKVFTLAGIGETPQLPFTSRDKETTKKRVLDTSEIFSIAMETGDADDEYLREEELANMGAQMQFRNNNSGSGVLLADGGRRSSACVSSLIDKTGLPEKNQSASIVNSMNSALFGEKGCQTNSSPIDTFPQTSFPLELLSQTSSEMSGFKVTSNMSAPWLYNNSRKRTLQDRTQFSDRDLYTLKRYWDNGMTSLGLVCKEKISAAANELNVDTEIIKTWIGNRRRKYRLMGIEIPPPKGGLALFCSQNEARSPQILEDEIPEGVDGSEHDDIGPLSLSDDEASDYSEKMNDYVNDGSDMSSPAKNVKIEIIDEADDGDMLTEMEQMQNFLEFKNEEVKFLEDELQNQKRKFLKLKSFTRSLLTAVKNKDQEKQQELLASLPQTENEDWGLALDNHTESDIEAT